ncbi:MAG: hypothetical protein R2874_13095 [Desulfobacterales bacterium]
MITSLSLNGFCLLPAPPWGIWCGRPMRRNRKKSLAPVHRKQGYQPVRQQLLLLGLLHVCHQEAMIAKEHSKHDLDTVIFNMDIRTFGKSYEKYYLRAKEDDGVRFEKARIHTIDPMPGTQQPDAPVCG